MLGYKYLTNRFSHSTVRLHVPRLAVILYAEHHQPRGGYAAMFRCVARLRTQHAHTQWYAAFGSNEEPTLSRIVYDAQRYGARDIIVVPWTLNTQPLLSLHTDANLIITNTLGSHPLVRDILRQRANEAHYLRSPADFHEHTAHTVFVCDAHTVVPSIQSQQLISIINQATTYIGEVILQPVALSQTDPLIHAITHQTAQGMPLERFGIGRAIEYDRRLLTLVNDIVAQHR